MPFKRKRVFRRRKPALKKQVRSIQKFIAPLKVLNSAYGQVNEVDVWDTGVDTTNYTSLIMGPTVDYTRVGQDFTGGNISVHSISINLIFRTMYNVALAGNIRSGCTYRVIVTREKDPRLAKMITSGASKDSALLWSPSLATGSSAPILAHYNRQLKPFGDRKGNITILYDKIFHVGYFAMNAEKVVKINIPCKNVISTFAETAANTWVSVQNAHTIWIGCSKVFANAVTNLNSTVSINYEQRYRSTMN